MNEPKKQYFTIGELSELVGVTVRTLQYYDRTGLLKAMLSEGGRRMYTRDDVIKLQQILFLKSFGFSLEEIERKLLRNKGAENLKAMFTEQREILTRQVENLRKMIAALDAVICEIGEQQDVGIDRLMILMKLMKQGNPYAFVLRYFNGEEVKKIQDRFGQSEQSQEFVEKAEERFNELKTLHQKGADPRGREGQALAARWWEMVTEFTQGDADLLKSLMSAGSDTKNWPADTEDFRDAIHHFLADALTFYFQSNHIHLPEQEENHHE
ncbi:MerR family transcriptional regulator [Caproicibacter fermentans]|uniref:MerR family transcriptional regulator n=1 Tax=Caproicibacter fermentans TaxID=2576756 RepID=A0A7G8TES0_9FIRM|nr:MerR family transcriptional regulator [Caproicibacter fermentans]QNK42111.1 MerR family transcriptional regulator [Caproicibacter fermentans]